MTSTSAAIGTRPEDRVFARSSYAHDKEDTSTRLPGLPAGFGSGTQFTYAHGGESATPTSSPRLAVQRSAPGFPADQSGYLPPYGDVPLSANLGFRTRTPAPCSAAAH